MKSNLISLISVLAGVGLFPQLLLAQEDRLDTSREKTLIAQIEKKVKKAPTGQGTIALIHNYLDKNVPPYWIRVMGEAILIRDGDPYSEDGVQYFLDIWKEGSVDRVLQIHSRITKDSSLELESMELNLIGRFKSFIEMARLQTIIETMPGQPREVQKTPYTVYFLNQLEELIASVSFNPVKIEEVHHDNENQGARFQSEWKELLEQVVLTLKN